MRRNVLRSVARGLPLTLAAPANGITYATLCAYRNQRKDFADALAQAIAKGVEKNLKVIENALESQDENIRLRSAMWFVVHTQPLHFARNRVEITGANGSPLAAAIAIYLPQKDVIPTVEVAPKQIENERH